MATSLTFTGALLASSSFLLSSSQLTPIVIAQGGTNGSRIYSIGISTNSSTAANHLLGLSSSAGIARLGVLAVTANSGHTAGTANFDYFGNALYASVFQKQKDANGVPYFNLAPGTYLTMQTSASVFLSAGSTSSIFVNGEFY